MKPLNILMIASECVPFAKTGGLADVVGALPPVLKARGHDVRVVIPLYRSIDPAKHRLETVFHSLGVWMGTEEEWCAVHRGFLPGDVPVYFVEFHEYFDREGLYHDNTFQDYDDNPRRFAFLTRAALQVAKDLGFSPDVVHAHDWQAAPAAAYLQTWFPRDPVLGKAASVLTIHNLAYQGTYPASHWAYLGLGPGNFVPDRFESHGGINFLKGGISLSDAVSTVSPTYARETLEPRLGYGLAPYLSDRGDDYRGILNGVDYTQWDPSTDPLIPARYRPGDLSGKAVCKRALQEQFGLRVDATIPIFGVVSRLAEQKGLDLLAETLDRVLATMHIQFVLLGNGDTRLERFYRDLAQRYPGTAGAFIGYSNEKSHLVEAGSDFFLMPSRFEPCGLNQIYSLRYGTLPVVRATGGLDDTVENYDEATGNGTGFKFQDLTPEALYGTIGWAVSTWYDRPGHYAKLQQRAMTREFSWESSAEAYEDLYRRAMENRARRD